MRELSAASGVENHHLLRATKLRKHLATKSAAMGLNDKQVNDLASFMGHEKDIHLRFYRMPVPELEINKMGCLLENIMEPLNRQRKNVEK